MTEEEKKPARETMDFGTNFRFKCHPGVTCFTNCCADVTIFLTPYDVARLKNRLGISSVEFMEKYTHQLTREGQILPLVVLKMSDNDQKTCPFVTAEGCTVYEDRPWACRMYPLGMAVPPARAGVEPEAIYFLFEDDFCEGHGEQTPWTARDWRADQGIREHEELEKGYRELVSHPWFIGGRQLDPRRMEMFHTACYDLDKFRRFLFESSFLERFKLEPGLVEQIRTDDIALLRFAFRWLRYALFAEPTMTARPEASSTQRKA